MLWYHCSNIIFLNMVSLKYLRVLYKSYGAWILLTFCAFPFPDTHCRELVLGESSIHWTFSGRVAFPRYHTYSSLKRRYSHICLFDFPLSLPIHLDTFLPFPIPHSSFPPVTSCRVFGTCFLCLLCSIRFPGPPVTVRTHSPGLKWPRRTPAMTRRAPPADVSQSSSMQRSARRSAYRAYAAGRRLAPAV